MEKIFVKTEKCLWREIKMFVTENKKVCDGK